MKTKVTLDVNKGEYGLSFSIETPEPIEIKVLTSRKLIITSNPPVTIITDNDIIELRLSDV